MEGFLLEIEPQKPLTGAAKVVDTPLWAIYRFEIALYSVGGYFFRKLPTDVARQTFGLGVEIFYTAGSKDERFGVGATLVPVDI